jgi:hypothetical protein
MTEETLCVLYLLLNFQGNYIALSCEGKSESEGVGGL